MIMSAAKSVLPMALARSTVWTAGQVSTWGHRAPGGTVPYPWASLAGDVYTHLRHSLTYPLQIDCHPPCMCKCLQGNKLLLFRGNCHVFERTPYV